MLPLPSPLLLQRRDGLLNLFVPPVLACNWPDVSEGRHLAVVQTEEVLFIRTEHLVELLLLSLESIIIPHEIDP